MKTYVKSKRERGRGKIGGQRGKEKGGGKGTQLEGFPPFSSTILYRRKR